MTELLAEDTRCTLEGVHPALDGRKLRYYHHDGVMFDQALIHLVFAPSFQGLRAGALRLSPCCRVSRRCCCPSPSPARR